MNKSTRIPYGPDQLQFGDLRLPSGPGPYPVAIVIHGGFWLAFYDLTLMDSICAALTEAGVATWNIEYRRVGNRGGGWPGTFQGVGLAADHLRELARRNNLDLDRVVSLGHSAGGHLALWLAGRHRIPAGNVLSSGTGGPLPLKTVVSLAGVNDLEWAARRRVGMGAVERLIGGGPDTHPERYAVGSPAALLPLGVRQILIHGTDDGNVPFEISRVYRDAAVVRGDEAVLIPLPGAGHFEVIDPQSREWGRVSEAVTGLAP
ncbi:MAG: alpha/beta fold hydrolase [Chloroflexi bacterium]|nr:alpha/beta fold hydrolase [Chloroflexota bacterium]